MATTRALGFVTAAGLLAGTLAVSAQSPQPEQQTKTLNLTAYAELLRSDVRTQKVAILTQPIYREYDAEMSKLADERVALIAAYAKSYGKTTDAEAEQLAAKAIDLDGRRQAALGRCYERVKQALSPRTALRFLQVEHQLQLLIDLQIASSLPIVM
jgi:hypothetical protein